MTNYYENQTYNEREIMTMKIQWLRNVVQLIFTGLLIAGLYMNLRMVIMILLPATLLFGNFFCGWVCPYGTIQEFFGAIGKRILKKKMKMPKSVQKYLQLTRYALMVVMTVGIAVTFFDAINSYKVLMRLNISNITLTLSVIIMISFALISIIFERPFCNYFCTEAVKYGVISLPRIFTIKRNENSCISCGKCDKACPMNISISDKSHVRNGQCINCFECTCACPVDETLTYGFNKYRFPRKKEKSDAEKLLS